MDDIASAIELSYTVVILSGYNEGRKLEFVEMSWNLHMVAISFKKGTPRSFHIHRRIPSNVTVGSTTLTKG